ncbi:MAG: transposase [Ignavibacteriales bacterium]|nr:transposase [Ignavibacteriales bacterium]
MVDGKVFYQRHLPHIQPHTATFFITFRLINSLSKSIVDQLKEEYVQEQKLLTQQLASEGKIVTKYDVQKKYFVRFDEFLDKNSQNNAWLKDERIADLVSDAIRYRDGIVYELICFTIMPNHVHMLISLLDSSKTLMQVLHSLKRFTAREANRILHRTGAFWQNESYDHIVRNGAELERIVYYIINNPVKAGLIDIPQKWKWTYCKYPI